MDLSAAAAWYRRAALQGVRTAQLRLAELYAKGVGVEKDAVRARAWLIVSGSPEQRHRHASIEGQEEELTTEEASRAETLAQTLRAKIALATRADDVR